MHGVMTTPLAILLQLDTLRIILLVLLGRIVAALALSACHRDQRTHEFSFTSFQLAGISTHESARGALVRAPRIIANVFEYYSMILVTRPEPTVRPPSRIANLRPSSMAIGWMSSPVMVTLSPGMTISVPSGRCATPVTSVVRK